MRLRTSVRSGAVLWAAPFALGLTLFYYFGNGAPPADVVPYAPTLASTALRTLYAVTYAVVAGLAAWESGRLKSAGVWLLAPARSRYRVAANALLPVLLLGWLMLLLPLAVSMVSARVLPTPGSLRPLALALLLCAGHAVLGFAVGLRIPRTVAAPLMVVLVWVLVAFSWATDPLWLRHLFGQYPTQLMFGELASLKSLAPHVLFTGGVAAGVALLWLPLRPALLRPVLACAVAVTGPAVAVQMVQGWGANPPLLTRQVPMKCTGTAPRVCLPEATAQRLPAAHRDVTAVLADLRAAGVTAAPELVTDRLPDGRFSPPSTRSTWRVSLTAAESRGDARLHIVRAAVQFPCERVDPVTGRSVMLWAATVTGQEKPYAKLLAHERQSFRGEDEVRRSVQEVLKQPAADQGAWFRRSVTGACRQDA